MLYKKIEIMKQLNENWFAITLIAVVFALLGFLLGKQQNKSHMMPHSAHMKNMKGMKSNQKKMWIGGKEDVIIDIDTLNKNGEKHIEVRVIKEN